MSSIKEQPGKVWQELQQIPKQDWAKYLKKNHKEIWYKLAWQKVNEWRDNQKNQAAVFGDTPDYSRQLFTLDDKASQMVFYAFKKYWQDGLLYKNAYLVNWSVGLQTALSDVAGEIEYEKRKDPFITFQYQPDYWLYTGSDQKIADFTQKYLKPTEKWPRLNLSTVRPETKFTDVAVAMHPSKFEEYYNLNIFETDKPGFEEKTAKKVLELIREIVIEVYYCLPPLNVKNIKFLLSDRVDANFGTGIVKITPAHDAFDRELYDNWVAKGVLTAKAIAAIGRDGKLTEVCGEFAGLTVEQARPRIIKRLLETGYIQKKESVKLEK